MAIFKPPHNIAHRNTMMRTVFLAGSIEMGKAEDWQTHLANFFDDNGWNVFNPRRDDWDSSWVQDFENPQFYQQVNWELNALSQSDLIIMYFAPGTQSPISLLEMGLYADSGKLHIVCPDGFWRKGNVEIVSNYYNIPFSNTIEELLEKLGYERNS